MAERIEGLSIELDLETMKINSGLKDLKSQLTVVNSEMKANMSAFDKSDKSIGKYETRLQGLNKKLDVQKAVTDSARKSYEKMVKEHGEGSKEANKAAKEYNNQVASLNNLSHYVGRVEDDLSKLKEEQRISNSNWTKMGDKLDSAGNKMQAFGDKAKNAGNVMSTTVTPAVLGIGAAVGLVASSYEDSAVRIQNALGLTAEETKELTDISRNIYKNGFGESAEEIDNAVLQTKQNIRDLNNEDLERITEKAFLLADTFDSDVNEVTRAGNNIMKGFAIEADEAFDLMAKGAQNGLNFSNEMFDNLSEYSTLFGSMGFSAEEYFELLQKGTKAGVYNLDYINDVMKEFQIRVKDGSDATSDAMDNLSGSTQEVWKEFQKGDKTVKDVSNAVLKELEGMDDQVLANQIGVELFGTKFEDLESDAMYSLGGIGEGIKDVDGTMDDMTKNAEQSISKQWKSTWREAKEVLLPVGETLLDFTREVLPDIKDGIEGVTDWFEELDDKGKKNILMFGGIVAAAGPVLSIVGGLSTGIGGLLKVTGSLTGAIGKKGATGGAGKASLIGGLGALTVSSGPLALATLGIAGLTAGGIALHNHMKQDVIPQIDLFGKSVSKNTEKAVGSFVDLNDEATTQLNQLSWSGQEVSEEMAESLTGTFDQMGKQIVEGLEQRKDESLTAIQELFTEAIDISEEEQAEILENVTGGFEERIETTKKGQERIKEILETASQENRSLTQSEQQEINQIQKKQKELAIETLTENEKEQQTILTRMKDQAADITARQAADTIKNSIKAKDGSVAEAEETYYKQVSAIEMMRDETGEITAEQARELIKNAEYQKNESIKKAEEMHQSVINTAKEQNPKLIEQVNLTTGEILTKWERLGLDAGIEFGKIYIKGKDVFDDLKGIFSGSIKMPSPTLASTSALINTAKWAWDEVRYIFSQKISMSAPTVRTPSVQYKQTPNWWAKGTPPQGHPGGHAILGDGIGANAGSELVSLPNGKMFFSADKPTIYPDLPRGTHVMPAKETKTLFQSIKHYADGTNGWGSIMETLNIRTDFNKLLALLGNQSETTSEPSRSTSVNYTKDLLDATLKQNKILAQLLAKDNSIYLDSNQITQAVNTNNAVSNIGNLFD
ncbi:phage tail tape measure protein [Radiobacillus sp. PE A8.2]|uniref:phage tail tape measure protein n=1 Tax=Radiobacillus sp. PE A8.2 TaxID=3380349 RepID=UPI00388FB1DA